LLSGKRESQKKKKGERGFAGDTGGDSIKASECKVTGLKQGEENNPPRSGGGKSLRRGGGIKHSRGGGLNKTETEKERPEGEVGRAKVKRGGEGRMRRISERPSEAKVKGPGGWRDPVNLPAEGRGARVNARSA